MSIQDDDTAATRLHELEQYYLVPHRTAPPGGRPTQRVHSPALVRLGIIEHMLDSAHEVERITYEAAPTAAPRTGQLADMYDWCRQQTADAAPELKRRREAVIYRQGLEHAIAAGDTKVVRRHRCPGCRTFGLFWQSAMRRAVCVNHYCTDRHGLSRSWSLARLAQQHVDGQESRARRAT